MTNTFSLISALRAWRIWWRLGVRDVRIGFRRSTLGISWIFINFAVTISVVGIVYGELFAQPARDFLPFLAAGLLVWTYLTSSVVGGSNAFLACEGYIKQIGISPFIYVLRFFVSNSMRMLITLAAYAIVALALRMRFGLGVMWALVGFALVGTASGLLIAIFAHINARFRDAGHLAALTLQVLFFITPVLWPAALLRDRSLGIIIDLNPLYHLIEIVRHPLLYSQAASLINYEATLLFLIFLALAAWLVTWKYHRRLAYLV